MDILAPNIAYASLDSTVSNIDKLIINPLIVFIFALALAYFLFGVLEFIFNQENETKRTNGKNHMLWGIVGLTIMMGIWFILGIILKTFNLNDQIKPETGDVKLNSYTPPTPGFEKP